MEQYDSCHIFCHETITFCLVCKEDISEELVYNKQLHISNHLQSIKHMDAIISLFKKCVPDPMCDSHDMKYLDIVHNCVFDISMLLNQEPCYMYKQEGQLFCMICEDSFSCTTDTVQTIKFNLVNHLQSEYHIQHLKDKTSWIYYMNFSTDFLHFHKSLLYCSVCKKSLDSSEEALVQTAVDHLQAEQHIPAYSVGHVRQSNNCENYNPLDQCNISCNLKKSEEQTTKSAVPLNLKKLLNRNVTLVLNKKYLKEKDNNFYCEICQIVIEYTVSGSNLKAHCYSIEHNQILIDNATRYILTLEQKAGAVYFSDYTMKFQSALNLFTRDSTLMSHLVYIGYDSDTFICYLCDESVRFTLCGKYIKSHFFRSCHQQKAYTINQNNNSLNSYKFDIESSQNPLNVSFERPNTSCNSDVSVICSNNTDLFDQPEVNEVFEALLEAQPLIKKNIQFIERNKQNYSCTICKTTILFSKWLHIIMVYFNAHFSSSFHKSQVKKIKASNNPHKVVLTEQFSTLGECSSKYPSTSTHINNSTFEEQNIASNDDDTDSVTSITGKDNLPTISSGMKCIADIKTKGLLKQIESEDGVETVSNPISNSIMFSDRSDLKSSKSQCEINIKEFDTSSNYDLFDKPGVSENFELLLETLPVVKKNRHLIERNNQHYSCMVCKINITSSRRFHALMICFNLHFNSKYHKSRINISNCSNHIITDISIQDTCKVTANIETNEGANLITLPHKLKVREDENVECVTKQNEFKLCLKKLVRKHGVLLLNQNYLSVKNDKFYCNVCQIYIEFTVKGSHLKAHCYSIDHNQVLTENATRFTVARQHDRYNPGDNYMQFELALSQFTKDTSLMPHLIYICYDSEHFFCLLCGSRINFTQCGKYIKHHFFHRKHLRKAFKTNQSSNCINVSYQSDVDFLDAPKGTKNMLGNSSQKSNVILNLNVNEEIKQVEDDIDVREKECIRKIGVKKTLKFQEQYVNYANPEEDDVKCTHCGRCVDIYNDDIEFSLQLHMQEHKDLDEINGTSDITHTIDTDYICPICQDVIPIFNKNVDLSITLHFTDVHADEEDYYTDSITTNL